MKACHETSEKSDVDFSNLSILHDECPELLMKIEVAQESYKLSIKILNSRSVLHIERLQKAQTEYLKKQNSEATYQAFSEHIDHSLRETMQAETDNCYRVIPETIELFIGNQKALLDAARNMFPDIEFFDHNAMFENGPA
jgi:hypothetical protein